MAKPNTFDVWFLTADQVYKGVPFEVVAGWVDTGRVSADDKVRPSGATTPWVRIAEHPLLADYRAPKVAMATTTGDASAPVDPPEPEMGHRKMAEDMDDDPDMIPLIDISLVLLVFFMMTTAVSALSPVDVPAISVGSELSQDVDALTVQIELRENGEVYYALRVGDQPIAKENNNLATISELNARMDAVLANVSRPPEVRIACQKKVKHIQVRQVVEQVLDKRKQKQQIAYYAAEVNEQPKQ
jgi:biopolymer transport protein ExbD